MGGKVNYISVEQSAISVGNDKLTLWFIEEAGEQGIVLQGAQGV